MKTLLVTALVITGWTSWADESQKNTNAQPEAKTQSAPADKQEESQSKTPVTPKPQPTAQRRVQPATPPVAPKPQNPAPLVKRSQGPVAAPKAQTTNSQVTKPPTNTQAAARANKQDKVPTQAPTTPKLQQAPVAKPQGAVAKTPGPPAKTQGPVAKTQGPATKPQGSLAKSQVPSTQKPAPVVEKRPPNIPSVVTGQVPPVHGPDASRVQQVLGKNQQMVQQNEHQRNFVDMRAQQYRTSYAPLIIARQQRYERPEFFTPWRGEFHPWVSVGFYAFAWDVHPVVEFYPYFTNPCVAWFYTDYDAGFYQPWYGQYFERYPELGRGFNRVGIFYPTEEFMTINVTVSDFEIDAQVNFRRGMIFLGDRLADRARLPLAHNDVVINHYQMLPNNRAVIVEGFVDNPGVHFPFRALVDLNDADSSYLFSTAGYTAGAGPTVLQMQDMYDMDDQVAVFGATLEVPQGM